jgi:hypothetical protein
MVQFCWRALVTHSAADSTPQFSHGAHVFFLFECGHTDWYFHSKIHHIILMVSQRGLR